jgi:transcriptional regulator with XRE-family HTH domain
LAHDNPTQTPNIAAMILGRRRQWFLLAWRRAAGLTQDALAEKLDVSKSKISDLETGKQRYTQDDLEALADVFECEPVDLLSHDPATAPPDLNAAIRSLRTADADDLPRIRAVLEALLGRA